jgi:RND family efflux transporter MFP subunit
MRESAFPTGAGVTDRRQEAARRVRARRLGLGALAVVAALVLWGAWGAFARHQDALETLGRINEVPIVHTIAVEPTDQPRTLTLPGSMEPVEVATIYARATGYVARREVDFGSRVKAGQVLAVIAAPDLDQQLSQARAQAAQTEAALAQAQATAKLQQATNNRTRTLVAEGWQTRQQGDTDALTLQADLAAARAAEANLAAQKANLSRLEQLAGFEQVTAPFDGTVTDRQVDVGSLVSADASTGTPMFVVERTDVLRVQVYVPQDAVFGLADGTTATITVPELPGRRFTGTISRSAKALAGASRTQLTQIDVANPDQILRAGLYCQANFSLPRTSPAITLPGQAVIFNHNGLSVALVVDGRIRLRPIELAKDDGATVEVKSGLAAGDQVVLSPPVNLTDGMEVKVAAS